jgi:hypothetical protein
MKHIFRNNGLTIVLLIIFLLFLLGHSIAGFLTYNQEQDDHHQTTLSYGEYLRTPAFAESVYENWESEILQMGAYILLTAHLFQKGSAESKDPDAEEIVDNEPKSKSDTPWPVRRGGIILRIYNNSLFIGFMILFVISFLLHSTASHDQFCQDEAQHGHSNCPTWTQYLTSSRLWYESFQNWQSEFLAVGSIVVLSIYLRQQGSPESKPVEAPHSQTSST